MTRYILTLITLTLPFWAGAQKKIVISGRISDETGSPVANAHVQIDGTLFLTTADEKGNFKLVGMVNEPFTIKVSHISFLTYQQQVAEASGELSIRLKENPYQLPQLFVVASRDQLFTKTPGSVTYLDNTELARLQPVSGNEVFRRATGLNVVDEEGAGLRVNIGIRGLDPDRSRNVLMMEDGVPVALNPYGEPEMYYTPAIDRMAGVEILKGSGQILYGPQTVGGVINYITATPPQEEEFGIRMQGGKGGYFSALGSYGNTFNNTGVMVNYLHKRADALGATRFIINDVTSKIKFPLSEKSTLGIKLAAYKETSNSTYAGITQRMYDLGGNDFSVLMPNDELDISRYQLSLSHHTSLATHLTLQSTLYAYTTSRNWRRQDYSYNSFSNGNPVPPPSDWTGETWGDTSVAGGAIYLRNRTGNRDRQFEVIGWEQKINFSKQLGAVTNELTAGYRYLYERAYEQRINGNNPLAKSGAMVSDEIRTGKAWAFFLLDKIRLSKKWDFAPGLRGEFYSYERQILREANQDVNLIAENNISEIIPGVGLNYRPLTSLNFFGGIHRGYAPPRIKDAIDFSLANPVWQLDAERSWNTELGLRTQLHKGLFAEFTFFHMDFANQIIPSSQSIGGSGFGLTNAGRTLHQGVESSINFNSRELLTSLWLFQLDINTTYVKAVYNSDRLIATGSEQLNVKGNQLPYAPKFTSSTALSIESPFNTGLRLTYTHVGSQFADELNTVLPSNNGRIGKIDAYNLIDATLYHKIPSIRASVNLSAKNITDERYIATRRPEGIRVGLPRFITAGFEIKF
jgi:Fe(3+) dicitrate transport protein